MREWKEYKLGELTELVTKGTTPTTIGGGFISNGVNFIKSEAVGYDGRIDKSTFVFISEETHQKLKRSQLHKDDILFSMAGVFLGKNSLVTEDMLPANTNQALAIIRMNKEKALPKFIHYYLRQRSVVDLVNNMSGQSAQPNINFEEIKSIDVLLPPFTQQTAIAEVLSSLDDKIDLLHRQNKTLEQLAETLFRQWFVEEAEETWEEQLLGTLIEIKGGFSYKGEFIGQGDSFLLGMGCVSFNERFLVSGARQYSDECPQKYLVNPGDIVIATRQQSDNLPILGYPAIVPTEFEGKNVIVGANLYRTINKTELSNYFFYLLLRSNDYRNHILASSKGSTVRMITKDAIESFSFKLPPTEQIKKFERIAEPMYKRLIAIDEQIKTLTQFRDSLLPKLMSGELRVTTD